MGDRFAHCWPSRLQTNAGPVAAQVCSEPTYLDAAALPMTPVQRLRHNQIDLWFAPLDLPRDTQQAFERTLSDDELRRASQFRFEHLASRYINAHGWLRHILSGYLQQPPDTVGFVYGPKGKPSISPSTNPEEVQFNMAHSDGLAAIVVTRKYRIGVDIELARPIPEAGELVDQFFSPNEAAVFRTLPEAERPVAFFNLWTRKEAWLKATGEGIAQLLNTVEVSFMPRQPAGFVRLPAGYSKPDDWSLFDVSPQTGVIAAVAVNSGSECKLQTHWTTTFPEVIS